MNNQKLESITNEPISRRGFMRSGAKGVLGLAASTILYGCDAFDPCADDGCAPVVEEPETCYAMNICPYTSLDVEVSEQLGNISVSVNERTLDTCGWVGPGSGPWIVQQRDYTIRFDGVDSLPDGEIKNRLLAAQGDRFSTQWTPKHTSAPLEAVLEAAPYDLNAIFDIDEGSSTYGLANTANLLEVIPMRTDEPQDSALDWLRNNGYLNFRARTALPGMDEQVIESRISNYGHAVITPATQEAIVEPDNDLLSYTCENNP